MPSASFFYFSYVLTTALGTYSANQPCSSEEQVEKQENREIDNAKVELLQIRSANRGPKDANIDEHRYLLVRPCERFAGDGLSGLPRHRVTGECCGDAICSLARWEDSETCPTDCEGVAVAPRNKSKVVLPPTETWVFGSLEALEHDEYHCEGKYDVTVPPDSPSSDVPQRTCSNNQHRASLWLEDLLERSRSGELPFEMPGSGSVALEVGAGEGQDSRNMAKLAGFALTAVDVSPTAIELAKNYTPPDMLGSGPGQIDFVAYDAMALPTPLVRLDYFFDATVYCSLRHSYLDKLYSVWSRLFTPGHTLVNIQCWNLESNDFTRIPQNHRDMEADFEPHFDILHSENCSKNQGHAGWCFYMKLKTPEAVKSLKEDRLSLQHAVRDGNLELVQKTFQDRFGSISNGELWTLYYIAEANSQPQLMKYLSELPHEERDNVMELVYGEDFEADSVESEDQLDGNQSSFARVEVEALKMNWERREAELIVQNNLKKAST